MSRLDRLQAWLDRHDSIHPAYGVVTTVVIFAFLGALMLRLYFSAPALYYVGGL